MHKQTIVIGGWAVTPDILVDCFGSNAIFIDCNPIMPLIIDNGVLKSDWIKLIKKELSLTDTSKYKIAGWSTGAIWALALSTLIQLKSLILISPTLSFCRRDGYRSGIRPSLLASMRNDLDREHGSVLSQFYNSCGIATRPPGKLPWTISTLIDGLHFLEQVNCRSFHFSFPDVCIIHGLQDSIIPYSAGETVASAFGAKFNSIEGGHAFFVNKIHETKKIIDLYNYKDAQ